MNHLLIAHPPNDAIIDKAVPHFATPPIRKTTPHASFVFFQHERSLFKPIADTYFLCGTLLNPDAIASLCTRHAFEDLDGVFVLAEVTDEKIVLVTDRFGFQPLYVYQRPGQTLYATSLDVLALIVEDKTINWNAWADLMTYGTCLEEGTQFNEITLVGHGHCIEIEADIRQRRYEDYMTTTARRMPLAQRMDELDAALNQFMVDLRALSTEIIAPLSGGMDSRLSTATLARFQPVHCFTSNKDAGKFGDHGEMELAEEVCTALNGTFTPIPLSPSFFPRYFHELLIQSNFETWIHTWYGPFIDALPASYSCILDGLGETAFKGDCKISKRSIALAKKQRWGALCTYLDPVYRIILMDRLTKQEEVRYFPDEIQQIIKARKKTAFAREIERYPKNESLPLNLLMNVRTKRHIGPSVYQIVARKYNVFSPYLSRDVSRVLLGIPLEEKVNHRFMQRFFAAKLPEVAGLPTTSIKTGLTRQFELLPFRLAYFSPKVVEMVGFAIKPGLMQGSTRYAEATYAWLLTLLDEHAHSPFATDSQTVMAPHIDKPVSYRIDILVNILMFELWYARYFLGKLEVIRE